MSEIGDSAISICIALSVILGEQRLLKEQLLQSVLRRMRGLIKASDCQFPLVLTHAALRPHLGAKCHIPGHAAQWSP